MTDVGLQGSLNLCFIPHPYCKIIREFTLSIVLMLISLNDKMLVMSKSYIAKWKWRKFAYPEQTQYPLNFTQCYR